VRSVTELCSLRVTVDTYVAPKDPLQCKRCQRCQRFGHTQRNCGHVLRYVACGDLTFLVCAQSLGGSPSAAAVRATTRRTTGVA
jgi:hypothetical protein